MKRLLVSTSLFTISFCQAQELSKAQLDTLVQLGKQTNSHSLIVVKDNKVLVEEYYGHQPEAVYLSSVSKVLVSIGIIKLINDGKIHTLDQPVADFYPEWKQGNKRFITIRMLLNHTSGLQNEQNADLELEPPPTYKVKNIVALALAAEVAAKPGQVFVYNNKAVALLGGIIEKASTQRMDIYFEETFFKPMHIGKYDWVRDEAGNPTAHGAFFLTARDLAKFGQLLLNRGIYEGKRYFEARWFDSSMAISHNLDQRIGLLWWRYSKEVVRTIDEEQIAKLTALHFPDTFINQLKPLFFQTFTSRQAYVQELEKQLGNRWQAITDSLFKEKPLTIYNLPKVRTGTVWGYYHTGYGGNYLVMIPALNMIVVRVVKRDDNYDMNTDSFDNFVDTIFTKLYKE